MVASTPYRQHGFLTQVSFFCGYFLLILSVATFGSAFVLIYNAQVARTSWTETIAEVRNCNLGVYASMLHLGSGRTYALRCELNYRIGGRPYQNSLHSDFTSSSRVRSDIVNWIAMHGSGANVTVRVNPREPYEYYVETPMPIKRRRDNGDDYIFGALGFLGAGLALRALGQRLAPAGW
jgi:hypothetical protein